jgi:hypothetical protein
VNTLEITRNGYSALRQQLDAHLANGGKLDAVVSFQGKDIVVSYGLYLLDYIESFRPEWVQKTPHKEGVHHVQKPV